MKKAKSSKAWIKDHINDFFVKQANKEGYRSRAAYKLIEISRRDYLLKPGMTVVDLGATPGGWSQVAANKVGWSGRVFSLDMLEMKALPNVTFIQGNFEEEDTLIELRKKLGERPVDLVISDMSPNISGIVISDQARGMRLAELALNFSIEQLNSGGNFLVKVFQGSGFEQFMYTMRTSFKQVVTRKPRASRGRSNEIYLLGLNKHGKVP
ncbi:MAG: RlmE family RNA methyltransferase [Nitrosomonadales bacterium]|jgi:23S rRNA (uridine2552-2'-O)-methyltransferase|nr:MAG: RlmE family RNA methyltransferase [Nitrosomonadales bacterium]